MSMRWSLVLVALLWGLQLQADDQPKVVRVGGELKLTQQIKLEDGFDNAQDITRLKEELINMLRVDALEACHAGFQGDSFILFKEVSTSADFADSKVTAKGSFTCSLAVDIGEFKYTLPDLLEGLADGNPLIAHRAQEALRVLLKEIPGVKEELKKARAELSPLVQGRLAELGIRGDKKEEGEKQAHTLLLSAQVSFRNFADWSPAALKGIETYLREKARTEINYRCATLSGEKGTVAQTRDIATLQRPAEADAPYLHLTARAGCTFNLEPATVTRNLRTLYSVFRFRDWELAHRFALLAHAGQDVQESAYWEKELRDTVPLSQFSRSFQIQMLALARLKGANRLAVLDALRPYLDSSYPAYEPIEKILKAWKHDSADWIAREVGAGRLTAERAGQYLGAWEPNTVSIALLDLLAKTPEAHGSVIGILNKRKFDGKEKHLFSLVRKVCEAEVKDPRGLDMAMKVIGKFKNPDALKVLNEGLLVGGLALSLHAQPDFVSATLDGIEPLVKDPRAKTELPNLKKVAELYYAPDVRKKAKNLLEKLSG